MQWQLLRRLAGLFSLSWAVGRDFNEICSDSKKCGGPNKRAEQIWEVLSTCDLSDLGWSGHQYTWSNRSVGADFVEERLDRFCWFFYWSTSVGNRQVIHLTSTSSDHSPIVYSYNRSQGSKLSDMPWGKRFYFQEQWSLG